MDKNIKRISIARCPVPDCDKTMMCPKRKTVLKVIEKPKVAAEYIFLPIIKC